jgi:methyl-accepting chemotaxis protein
MFDALLGWLTSSRGTTPDVSPDGGVQTDDGAGGTVTPGGHALDLGQLLDGVGTPLFALDADGCVVAWNSAIEELTGVPSSEALGTGHVSEAFYPDGRRAKTLADKVLERPEDADRAFDIDRMAVDSRLYVDSSVMTDRHGVDRHIRFNAMPIYDGDDLAGVVEVVHDRTDVVEKSRQTQALVDELGRTIRSVAAGNLADRAEFEDDLGVLDDDLLVVLDEFNGMAARFETLTAEVDETAGTLSDAIDHAADAAGEIESQVHDQNDLLARGAEEMQDLSASMEEIAATSDDVASAAEQARTAADEGQDAGESVREATDNVIEISDDLLESVVELQERMGAIEEVVEVIAEVADRTNLLALNANIEAARAGDAGAGFSVVADEVKQLANQTHEHTEEIASSIEEIQAQADETVTATQTSHEQIEAASGEIEGVLESLADIGEAADAAASGVQEVARATDGQATNIEEVTTTIQTVRERASETEAASGRITDATSHQAVAIDDLQARVDQLCGRAEMDGDAGVGDDAGNGTGGTEARSDGGARDPSGFQFGR